MKFIRCPKVSKKSQNKIKSKWKAQGFFDYFWQLLLLFFNLVRMLITKLLQVCIITKNQELFGLIERH